MKCSIKNYIIKSCFIFAASFCAFSHADAHSNVEARCHRHSSSSSDLQFNGRTILSSSLWQTRSAFIKAGVQNIASAIEGDYLSNLNEELFYNARLIDAIIGNNRKSCSDESIRVLLVHQADLLFDYSEALTMANVPAQDEILIELRENNEVLTHAITNKLGHGANKSRIRFLMTRYLNQAIAVTQNFVTATNSGTVVDYQTAYTSYEELLRISNRLGNTLGRASS